jgi:hypothetical protein
MSPASTSPQQRGFVTRLSSSPVGRNVADRHDRPMRMSGQSRISSLSRVVTQLPWQINLGALARYKPTMPTKSRRRAIWPLWDPLGAHQPHQPHPRHMNVACNLAAYALRGAQPRPLIGPTVRLGPTCCHGQTWGGAAKAARRGGKSRQSCSAAALVMAFSLCHSFTKKGFPCPSNMEFLFLALQPSISCLCIWQRQGGEISAASPL